MIVILWLALWLRVWQLDALPPGLHYDEAFNGTMARDVLRGVNRPIFFTPNFGEEPLHIYTEALLFAFLGESPWTIRLVSALFGVLCVVALYSGGRALFHSELVALVSAFVGATLYWAINFSRIGIEPNGLPLVLTLSAAALALAWRTRTWGWALAAGILTGAVLYTYLASRLWLVAVALWFLYLIVFHRAAVRGEWNKWVAFALAVLLTLGPLALFFVANPVALSGRSGTVFTPETFGINLARTAGMFILTGDTDPRDNLPGRPALDLVLAVFFVIGCGLTVRNWRKPLYALLAIWILVMCLPSALTEFAPNFRRAIGALPATILLCALGFEWLWQYAARFQLTALAESPGRALNWTMLLRAVLVVLLLQSAVWNGRAYFVEWASNTGLFYSFDAGILQLARALAARPPDEALYLSPNYRDHYTVRWALDGRDLASFDGRRALVLPSSKRAATYGIITHEDSVTLVALRARGAKIQPIQEFADATGAPYAALVQVQADEVPAPLPIVRMGEFGELVRASAAPASIHAGERITVTLEWRARSPAPEDYTVFVHAVGPTNPATQSPIWAQDDRQPGGGTFPTRHWQSGDRIIETYALQLPSDAPPAHYTIQVGLYLVETGERVPLWNADGSRVQDDAFSIATFDLQ